MEFHSLRSGADELECGRQDIVETQLHNATAAPGHLSAEIRSNGAGRTYSECGRQWTNEIQSLLATARPARNRLKPVRHVPGALITAEEGEMKGLLFHRSARSEPIPEEHMPRDIDVKLPEPPVNEVPRDLTRDPERDAMMSAAAAYDRAARRQVELQEMLIKAQLGLEAKNREIAKLELDLATERNRVTNYQNERDQAVQDRSDLAAFVAGIRAQFERFELPMPIIRRGKRRPSIAADANGGSESAMSDARTSEEPVAGGPPLLARPEPLLDQ
jgi:hypothetical protein